MAMLQWMPQRSNEFKALVWVVREHVADSAAVVESAMLDDAITGEKRDVDVWAQRAIWLARPWSSPSNGGITSDGRARPGRIRIAMQDSASHLFNERRATRMVGIPLLIASSVAGVRTRLDMPTAEEIRKVDKRDPVAYVRSFDHEIEEQMTFGHLKTFVGPVIAVSRPGKRLKPFGAARLDGGENWKQRVKKLLRESCVVVYQCTGTNESSGYMWELSQLIPGLGGSPTKGSRPLVEPTKLIGMIEGGRKNERRYVDWAAMVQPALAGPLPPVDALPGKKKRRRVRAWVTFTEDWTPAIVPTDLVSDWYYPAAPVLLHAAARKPLDDLAQSQLTAHRRLAEGADADVTAQLEEAHKRFDRRLLEVQMGIPLEFAASGEVSSAVKLAKDNLHLAEYHFQRKQRKQRKTIVKRAKEVLREVEAAARDGAEAMADKPAEGAKPARAEQPDEGVAPLSVQLRQLAASRGLTQQDLAQELGVSTSTVSRWLNGVTRPNRRSLPMLAETLGVSTQELVRGTTDQS
jgi:ribosome-binding protein aMBF1 (putative translation factor)